MLLPGKGIKWKDFVLDIAREWDRDKIDTIAGALAFFGMLALFPFLVFVVSLTSLLIEPATAAGLVNDLYRFAPRAVADIVAERIHALTTGQSPALLTLSAVGAIWAASGGVASLTEALNTAYGVTDSRPFWKRRALALVVTICGAILVVIASVIAVATPSIASALGEPFATVILWARLPVSAFIVMGVLAVLYYVLPDVEQQFKFITLGSVVAVLLWLLASLGFSYYVGKFGSYEVTYGALGGVIVLLMWMWISSMAVLLGAEINAIIEHRSPDGKRTGAKSMSNTGTDVPKTIKEEQNPGALDLPRPNVARDAAPPAPAAPAPAPAAVPPTPRTTASRRSRGNPIVDAVLGVSALIVGFVVGKKIRQ